METILDDNSKFTEPHDDLVNLTMKRESKVPTVLREFKKEVVITNQQYQNFSPTGSQPGILYGLPKIHKPNRSVRTILSAIFHQSFRYG